MASRERGTPSSGFQHRTLWSQSIEDLAQMHDLWPDLDSDSDYRLVFTDPEVPDPRNFIPAAVELPALPDDENLAPDVRRQAQLARLTCNQAVAGLTRDSLKLFTAASTCYSAKHREFLKTWQSMMSINYHILITTISI